MDKKFLSAFFFYLCAFVADATVTSLGISSGKASEGDPVALWLWSIFGTDSFLLKVIYVIVIFLVSYFLYKKLWKFLGLWLPFSLGAGHIMGFLTWQPYFFKGHFDFIQNLNNTYGINGIFITAPILGFVLAFAVSKM